MMMDLMQESMKSSLTLNHGLTGISKQLVNALSEEAVLFAPAAASHGGSDATSGASDAGGHGGDAAPAADATSGASFILRLGKVGTTVLTFFSWSS